MRFPMSDIPDFVACEVEACISVARRILSVPQIITNAFFQQPENYYIPGVKPGSPEENALMKSDDVKYERSWRKTGEGTDNDRPQF